MRSKGNPSPSTLPLRIVTGDVVDQLFQFSSRLRRHRSKPQTGKPFRISVSYHHIRNNLFAARLYGKLELLILLDGLADLDAAA